MPNEKAHGIHIAKMCEALIEAGYGTTLVVPSRATDESVQGFYKLRVPIPTVRLPSFVFKKYERLGFAIMSSSFMVSYGIFLLWKKITGEKFFIYTVDIDTFSHTLLPLFGPTVGELHSPKRSTILSRFFARRAKIVATNPLIAQELKKIFSISTIVEPNGVDESFFNLSGHGAGPLYVGRFYTWKGLDVLAATGMDIQVLGGSKEEFEKIFGSANNLRFAEATPAEVPHWLARADVLLLTGTAKNQDSNRYTAPMKVFEYLATGKPIVASATEALQSLVPNNLVIYCQPDNPEALVSAITQALQEPGDSAARITFAREHTWHKRSQRILDAFLK